MIERFLQRLTNNDRKLREVAIVTLQFHEHDLGRVFDALKTNTKVRTLDLSHYPIEGESREKLLEMLKENTKICQVNISYSNLANDIPFLELLRELPKLRVLIMNEVSFFIERLEFAGLNPNLTTLSLHKSNLVTPDRKKFFDMLRAMPNLISLDISYTMYSDGPEVLAYLSEGPPLRCIKLAGRNKPKLAAALMKCPNLTELQISHAHWDAIAFIIFAPLFRRLRALVLYGGVFSQSMGPLLIDFIEQDPPCQYLNLAAHEEGYTRHTTSLLFESWTNRFTRAVEVNTHLTDLRLPSSCRIVIYNYLDRNRRNQLTFAALIEDVLGINHSTI